MHEVHKVSPASGKAKARSSLGKYLAGSSSANRGTKATATAAQNYIAIVDEYADRQQASQLSFVTWEQKGAVAYGNDVVEVIVRAVMRDSSGGIWGRLAFWDTAALDPSAAELLACPCVELLDQVFSPQPIQGVEAWQCRTGETHTVTAAAARRQHANVASYITAM
jgi:hypothetical protein